MRQIRTYVFLYFSATVLLQFAYRSLDHVTRGYASEWREVLIEQATGGYGAAILVPFILWTVRKYPLRLSMAPLLRHLLSLVVFSSLHTIWNWETRRILFLLFGLGPYDYGRMTIRFFMEFPSDVIVYSLTAGIYTTYRNWLRIKDVETELVAARLDNLTRQLQPHFLFNALNAVSGIMYEDVGRADRMLEGLSDFLRATTKLPDAPLMPVSEELKLVTQYLNVMKMRLEHRLEFNISCDSAAGAAHCPPLLLQPLVENAVEHGQDPISGNLHISIDVRRNKEFVEIAIRDHGCGPDTNRQGTGHGITNTLKRLATVYRGAATFRLTHHPEGGAIAELSLPA